MAVAWTAADFEPVPACPVCAAPERTPVHDDLDDITFGNVSGPFTMVACAACAALYLDPRPRPEAIGAAYRRYYTHAAPRVPDRAARSLPGRLRHMLANDYRAVRYGARVGARLPAGYLLLALLARQRDRIDSYYRYLPRRRGRLLDFGCGNGAYVRLARDELGWQARGMDFDPGAVAGARAAGLDVVQGGPETLAAMRGRFEAITLSHVLEHVYDPRGLMASVFERLEPGGFVFVETPNATAGSHAVFGRHWRGLEAPRHLVLPGWRALERLLKDAGFVGLRRHPRLDTFVPMYKRSAALADGQSSEDPASQDRPGPPPEMIAAVAADPELCEYVTMTARKPG